MQLVLNILLSSSIYLILCLSFTIIYQTTRIFHIAHAITITLGPYYTFMLAKQCGIDLYLSIPIAVVFTIISAISIEIIIYRPLRQKKTESWQMLIASLGVYICLQNVISIIWGDETKSIRTWPVTSGHHFFGAYITTEQIISIVVSLALYAFTLAYLKHSRLGKEIRAVSSNRELSDISGVNATGVILWSFAIGSGIAAVVGILLALDSYMTPTMGFSFLLYAVVTMIIGGMGSYRGLVYGAILLASAQHLSAYYISSKWMDGVAYIILILFLAWKPLGFSGIPIKKIEI